MRSRIDDPNVARVYVVTFALGLAYGIVLSLIALHLDGIGTSKRDIGALAAWFAGGIVLGSLPAGALVGRVGAKRLLVAVLGGYGLTVGVFPFVDSFWALAVARVLDGAFSAATWVSCETILLARSQRAHKAFVMSLYAIALAIGYVVGPLAARLLVAFSPMEMAFPVAGALAIGAAGYAGFRLDAGVERASSDVMTGAPSPSSGAGRLAPALDLFWRIKISCLATFCYGYFQASVVLFLPLYLVSEKGIARDQTILVPAFFALGMLTFASVAGRLGDRYGHVRVLRGLACVGASMILSFVHLTSFAAMCAAVFVAGASLASISPVSLALQGLVVAESDFGRATAQYNAFYAAGMLIGPPASSWLFETSGGASMLHHLVALWTVFVAATVLFRRDAAARSIGFVGAASGDAES